MFAFFGLGKEEFEKLANCSTCMMFPMALAILVFVILLFRQSLKKPPRD
jgi:hypothetical protein